MTGTKRNVQVYRIKVHVYLHISTVFRGIRKRIAMKTVLSEPGIVCIFLQQTDKYIINTDKIDKKVLTHCLQWTILCLSKANRTRPDEKHTPKQKKSLERK